MGRKSTYWVVGYGAAGAAAALSAHEAGAFPQLSRAQGLRLVLRRLKQTPRCPQPTGGARMWHLLDRQLRTRGIPVRCAAAVRDLLIDGAGRSAARW